MLYPFLIVAVAAILGGIGSAIVGYDLWEQKWVYGLENYFRNYVRGAAYVLGGLAFIIAYVWLFGMPTPE